MANAHVNRSFKVQCFCDGCNLSISLFLSLSHRSAGLDSSWLHAWPSQGVDGAGPSTAMRSVGLGRVQMMMRHLATVGETYAQTTLEDAAWSLWPLNPSQAAASGSPVPPVAVGRYPGGTGGLHMRTASHSANDNIVNILAMAETVREVLPHIPDELIVQVLFGFYLMVACLSFSNAACAGLLLVSKSVCVHMCVHLHVLDFHVACLVKE